MSEEVHGFAISDLIIGDGYFACTMTMDVTLKGVRRVKSTEICVYKVKNGKITREYFFHE